MNYPINFTNPNSNYNLEKWSWVEYFGLEVRLDWVINDFLNLGWVWVKSTWPIRPSYNHIEPRWVRTHNIPQSSYLLIPLDIVIVQYELEKEYEHSLTNLFSNIFYRLKCQILTTTTLELFIRATFLGYIYIYIWMRLGQIKGLLTYMINLFIMGVWTFYSLCLYKTWWSPFQVEKAHKTLGYFILYTHIGKRNKMESIGEDHGSIQTMTASSCRSVSSCNTVSEFYK